MVVKKIKIEKTCKCGCTFSFTKKDTFSKKESCGSPYLHTFNYQWVKCPLCKHPVYLWENE